MWGSEPHARMTETTLKLDATQELVRRPADKNSADWTEPTALNAPRKLRRPSAEPFTAPRAISLRVRSDKGGQSTPPSKADTAPLDAMAQHWLLATLVATALALVPPATTAPGLTKLSAYVPSGTSRRHNSNFAALLASPTAAAWPPRRRRGGACSDCATKLTGSS